MTMAQQRTEDDQGNRHYLYPATGEQLVSVTTVLAATLGKPWLPPWAAGITSELAVSQVEYLLALIADEGRDEAVKWLKGASERIRDVKRDAGGHVHDVVEKLVLWAASPEDEGEAVHLPSLPEHLIGATMDDEPIEEVIDFMVTGFLNWVRDFNPRFSASEMTVYHPVMGWAGTLDAIVELDGYWVGRSERLIAAPGRTWIPCVDVKTGKYPECTWKEQVSAYRRARQANAGLGNLVPMPRTDGGAVLWLRPEFERGYRFMPISAEQDALAWNRFRRAADIYHGRRAANAKPGKVSRPLRPDGTMPSPLLCDLDGEGYGRAPGALHRAGIKDLEQVAGMTAGQLLAVKNVGKKTIDVIRRMLADHGLHLAGETPSPDSVPLGEVA